MKIYQILDNPQNAFASIYQLAEKIGKFIPKLHLQIYKN
jgi:hypothetical protein